MKGFCRSTTATETAIGGILAIAGDRFRFQAWWWLYFLRRGKEGEGWEGVAGDRVSPVGKKCNLPNHPAQITSASSPITFRRCAWALLGLSYITL